MLKTRMASIEPNGVIGIIRLKWEWELIYLKRMANEAHRLSSDQSLSGERLAIDALELAGRSTVHPIWFQKEYRSLLTLLERPKERWKKAANIFSSAIDKFRDK